MLSLERDVRGLVATWLDGRDGVADLSPLWFGGEDVWELLESDDDAASDRMWSLALACALCAGDPGDAGPVPALMRQAPLEVQVLWFAASTHAAPRLGRWRIVLASPELEQRGLVELDEEIVLEEMERRESFEQPWHITLHTARAQLAVSDWPSDGWLELRWNRGDASATLLHVDDDQAHSTEGGWATWVEAMLGIRTTEDRARLKKKAAADSSAAYRRLWELCAYLSARRKPQDLQRI